MYFEISYYGLVVALFLLTIIFLCFPLPKCEEIKNYKVSLKVLACSYLILGLYCIYKSNYQIQLISLPFLISATMQSHMLAMSHINMVNPKRITRSFIIRQLIPIAVFLPIYLLVRCFYPHYSILSYDELLTVWWQDGGPQWEVLLRMMWMVYYVCQICYYTYVFLKDYRQCKKNLGNFVSDNLFENLRCILISTICVVLVATDTLLIPMVLDPQVCVALNFVILILYCAIGVFFLQYPKVYYNITQSTESETDMAEPTQTSSQWVAMDAMVKEQRLYALVGVTIQELAKRLKSNRNLLSNMINQYEGVNYNSYINRLRIEEAQRIISENPSFSVAEVAEQVGYSDQSNFSRHFKEWTGVSPTEWRKNCGVG